MSHASVEHIVINDNDMESFPQTKWNNDILEDKTQTISLS